MAPIDVPDGMLYVLLLVLVLGIITRLLLLCERYNEVSWREIRRDRDKNYQCEYDSRNLEYLLDLDRFKKIVCHCNYNCFLEYGYGYVRG